MKNVLSMNNRWACIAMNHKIKLKPNAQDTFGKRMKIDAEYNLILLGHFYSIIEDDRNKQYYINNKYIDFESEN